MKRKGLIVLEAEIFLFRSMKDGIVANSAIDAHMKNIICIPSMSAMIPKSRGATVLATLVQSELML